MTCSGKWRSWRQYCAVAAAGADAIALNGDIADGPMPVQILDRLEERESG